MSSYLHRSVNDGGKRAVYILNDEDKCTIIGTYIKQLTDLKVLTCNTDVLEGFDKSFENPYVRKNTQLLHICC